MKNKCLAVTYLGKTTKQRLKCHFYYCCSYYYFSTSNNFSKHIRFFNTFLFFNKIPTISSAQKHECLHLRLCMKMRSYKLNFVGHKFWLYFTIIVYLMTLLLLRQLHLSWGWIIPNNFKLLISIIEYFRPHNFATIADLFEIYFKTLYECYKFSLATVCIIVE